MKTITETTEIKASADVVFAYVDDIHNTGWHMMKSSMPLMGSKLNLEILSQNPTGAGATYRCYGKVLGLTIDFTETVIKWIPGKERVWRTIGKPKIIIMKNYEMWFTIEPIGSETRLTFGITYDLPRSLFWKMIGLLLAGWYSRWCLENMCSDAKKALESNNRIDDLARE
ncbi:MAG: SRPBCC family protein [Actinobacteria bacterium]|nr:SRPBCC family protein [Actinomycetota bacterium]